MKRGYAVEALIGVALYSIAGEQARQVIQRKAGCLTAAELERLAESTLCRQEFPEVETVLESEWRRQRATIERSFSADGVALVNELHDLLYSRRQSGFWQVCLEKASLLLHAGKRETLERIHALRERSLAAGDDPTRDADLERMRDELGEYRHSLVMLFDPGALVENVTSTLRLAIAGRDATAAQVATLRYHLAEGVWPPSAAALVRRFLPALPEDVEPGTTLGFEPATLDKPPIWKSARLRLEPAK
ncbi:MAG: hypothetical protein V2A76_00220 [Planctomycetota bacterium]